MIEINYDYGRLLAQICTYIVTFTRTINSFINARFTARGFMIIYCCDKSFLLPADYGVGRKVRLLHVIILFYSVISFSREKNKRANIRLDLLLSEPL